MLYGLIGRLLRTAWQGGRAQKRVEAWVEQGAAYHAQRDLSRAAACYRAALAAAPAHAGALVGLGVVLNDGGRRSEALPYLQSAYELEPSSPGAFRSLVSTLVELDRCEDALRVAEAERARSGGAYEAGLLLGFVHQRMGDPALALQCYDAALAARRDDPELYFNRGVAYQDLGRLAEACADYERTCALSGDFPLAAFHLSLARLLMGDYGRGWDGYVGRKISGGLPKRSRLPDWDGGPLAGRTLAIVREQGIGDEIMFASTFAEVLPLAQRCIIECHPRLEAIFRRSFPAATTSAAFWTDHPDAPAVEVEVAAGDLPRFLRRTPDAFPEHRGYLKADPQKVRRWARRLAELGDGPKIGLAWTGGTPRSRRALRSIPLEQLSPILGLPARFVSLQYTAEAGAEVAAVNATLGRSIVHWPEAVEDLDETAALLCALDRVVSVCTAVVHLGGALGRPVWVLAPYSPEWRYGLSGERMAWYPSVRVFRQAAFGQWDAVIAGAAAELRGLV